MIIMAVLAVIMFLNILSFTVEGVVTGLIYGIMYAYEFIVLYSLRTMFREESERGFNTQYRQPGSKV